MTWEEIDRTQLREFLNGTSSGKRLLDELQARINPLKGDTLESRAISASEQAGYYRCMQTIEELSTPSRSDPTQLAGWVHDKPPKDFDPEKHLEP